MTPLPGFDFANWETGYGDFRCVPDPSTLRIVPWLEKTALVLCDLYDEETRRAGRGLAPPDPDQRQVERAAALGYRVMCASELEFFLFRESYEEAQAKRFQDLTPHSGFIEDYHILQTTRDEYLIRQIRNGMDGAGVPVEFSKGEAGQRPARDQPALRRRGDDGRPARHLQERREGDRRAQRPVAHVHGEVLDGRRRVVVPRALEPLERRRHRVADVAGGRARPHVARRSAAGSAGSSRPDASSRGCSPRPSTPTSATSPSRGRRPRSRGAATTARAGSGSSGTARASGSSPASPAPTATRTSRSRRRSRPGLHGIEHEIEPPPMLVGNAYEAPDIPHVPWNIVDAIAEFERSEVADAAFGDAVHQHLVHAARQEWAVFNQAVTDWELRRNFEQF